MPRFKHKAFSAPGYNESAAPSVSPFGLAFDSRTATDLRTEVGSWANRSFKLSDGNELDLSGRVGWAHDWQSSSQLSATFAALPTASFVVTGAMPAPDRLLQELRRARSSAARPAETTYKQELAGTS